MPVLLCSTRTARLLRSAYDPLWTHAMVSVDQIRCVCSMHWGRGVGELLLRYATMRLCVPGVDGATREKYRRSERVERAIRGCRHNYCARGGGVNLPPGAVAPRARPRCSTAVSPKPKFYRLGPRGWRGAVPRPGDRRCVCGRAGNSHYAINNSINIVFVLSEQSSPLRYGKKRRANAT